MREVFLVAAVEEGQDTGALAPTPMARQSQVNKLDKAARPFDSKFGAR
jgi:hypothetical protein